MKAFLDYNGRNVPVVVWEKILHIRKKFHLSIVGLDIADALTDYDYNVLTVYVEPARCISSRHFKNIERKAYRKLMAHYGWDINFVENEEMSPYYQAHAHTFANYREVMASKTCGCCYCGSIFSPTEVIKEEHTCIEPGKDDVTVICPYCSVDAVFGDASGYKPTEELLRKMYWRWFVKE